VCVYIYIYIEGVGFKLHLITINNVILSNNLLLNSFFENFIVESHVLNMHTNFHVNQILFII